MTAATDSRSDAEFLADLERRYGPPETWRRFRAPRPIQTQRVRVGRPLTPAQAAAWRDWTATMPPGADLPF